MVELGQAQLKMGFGYASVNLHHIDEQDTLNHSVHSIFPIHHKQQATTIYPKPSPAPIHYPQICLLQSTKLYCIN